MKLNEMDKITLTSVIDTAISEYTERIRLQQQVYDAQDSNLHFTETDVFECIMTISLFLLLGTIFMSLAGFALYPLMWVSLEGKSFPPLSNVLFLCACSILALGTIFLPSLVVDLIKRPSIRRRDNNIVIAINRFNEYINTMSESTLHLIKDYNIDELKQLAYILEKDDVMGWNELIRVYKAECDMQDLRNKYKYH